MAEKSFEIRNYSFNQRSINNLAVEDHLEENWPVVYQIYNNNEIYIGENFSIFFEFEHINQNFKNKNIALVVPQQSLRGRISKIFKKINLGDA